MNLIKRTTIVLALGLAASGCSVLESKPVAREDLKNAQGHVIGIKETVRDVRTGEEATQLSLFVPHVGPRGEILGYEERVAGGTVLHDLNGKKIGGRILDLRSRGTNPQGGGLMIVVRGKNYQPTTVAEAPSIDELMQLARIN